MALSLILLIFAFVIAVVAVFWTPPRVSLIAASLACGWLGLALGAGLALH